MIANEINKYMNEEWKDQRREDPARWTYDAIDPLCYVLDISSCFELSLDGKTVLYHYAGGPARPGKFMGVNEADTYIYIRERVW